MGFCDELITYATLLMVLFNAKGHLRRCLSDVKTLFWVLLRGCCVSVVCVCCVCIVRALILCLVPNSCLGISRATNQNRGGVSITPTSELRSSESSNSSTFFKKNLLRDMRFYL